MSEYVHPNTYPASAAVLTGKHRLVGWGNFDTMRESILPRVFGYLVRLATHVAHEYHGDLFHDAEWLRKNLTGETSFLYLVRYSGTNLGDSARLMFESLAYDAVLYNIDLSVDERGTWWLTVDLIDARPTRPVVTEG